MWWIICKTSYKQLVRSLYKTDKNLLLVIVFFLGAIQVYLYRDFDESISVLPDIDITQFNTNLFLTLGALICIITLLFLYSFRAGENIAFLIRLPIKKSDLFKATHYPFLSLLIAMYLLESISLNLVILKHFKEEISIVVFVIIYVLYLIFCVLGIFALKHSIEYIFNRLKMRFSLWVEFPIILVLLFSFIFSLLVLPSSIQGIHPINWFIHSLLGSYEYIILIVICLSLMIYFINYQISRFTFIQRREKYEYKNQRFYSLPILNGMKLEYLSIVRDFQKIKSISISILLGNFMMIVASLLIGQENQSDYFHFLIFSIVLGFSNFYLYQIRQINTLKLYPIDLNKLIIGKNIFYILAINIIFICSLLFLLLLGNKLSQIEVLNLFFRLFLFISITTLLNVAIGGYSHSTKTIVSLVSITIYGIVISLGNIIVFFNYLLLLLSIVLFVISIKVYKEKMKKEGYAYDIVQ